LSERERSSIQNKFDEPLFGRFLSSYESFKKKVLHDRERGKNRTHYILGIFERRSGQLVGQLDLYLFNDELKWTNLGYHIQNQFWGMGHAPEACRSLLKYAFKFLNIHRVEILMLAENIASLHVAEKLDMVFEGTRTNFFPGERSGELHIFAMNAFDAKK
jgi:ribosomal-protein-alanine N-acetyltransferase